MSELQTHSSEIILSKYLSIESVATIPITIPGSVIKTKKASRQLVEAKQRSIGLTSSTLISKSEPRITISPRISSKPRVHSSPPKLTDNGAVLDVKKSSPQRIYKYSNNSAPDQDASVFSLSSPDLLSQSFCEIFLRTHSIQHIKQNLDKDILRAAGTGKTDLLLRLLQHSYANPNCCTVHGMTPLHYASAKGWVKVTEILLQAGADPEAVSALNKSPLDLAIMNNHEQVIILLRASLGAKTIERNQYFSNQPIENGILAGNSVPIRSISMDKKVIPIDHVQINVQVDRIEGPVYARFQTYAVCVRANTSFCTEKSFTVRKRFSDFFLFYADLLRSAKEAENNVGNNVHRELVLWRPRKVLFGSTVASTVEQRRNSFEYLLQLAINEKKLARLAIHFLCPQVNIAV